MGVTLKVHLGQNADGHADRLAPAEAATTRAQRHADALNLRRHGRKQSEEVLDSWAKHKLVGLASYYERRIGFDAVRLAVGVVGGHSETGK